MTTPTPPPGPDVHAAPRGHDTPAPEGPARPSSESPAPAQPSLEDPASARPSADPDVAAGTWPPPDAGRRAEPSVVLDCLGRRCPLPVIELARRIGDIEPGAVIGVLADDPAARVDIPAWCRMRRQEYLGPAESAGAPLYLVRRTAE